MLLPPQLCDCVPCPAVTKRQHALCLLLNLPCAIRWSSYSATPYVQHCFVISSNIAAAQYVQASDHADVAVSVHTTKRSCVVLIAAVMT